ncbi:MAG: hypothetical protein KatS3mg102_1379 [Planctomycetota bacterium]|nr:MAG: hypothetical protein KatS3mg102_1379 [Planctomycetota bacterium]
MRHWMRAGATGALLAAALLLGWLARDGRAQAEQAAAGGGEAGRAAVFEHRILFADYNAYRDSPEFKELVRQAPSELYAVYAYQQLLLERAGKQGWRLVHVESKLPSQAVFYLERRAR